MVDQNIVNPLSAMYPISDYRTFKADDGTAVTLPGTEVELWPAAADLTAGFAVAIASPTSATTPCSIVAATASTGNRNLGVVTRTVKAGQLAPVVTKGLAFVKAGGTITANAEVAVNADGEVEAVTPAATVVVGTVFGVALKAGVDGDTIPIYVSKR